ncbi:MAG: hypothetical protein MJE63_33750, partial [Proteobacteria bacterium]|nr:hypothetical protein [Pseudomonadota bacterium]
MKKLFAEFPDNKVLLLFTSNPYLFITREKQDRFSGVKPGLTQLKIPSLKKPGHSINTYTLPAKERGRWLN